MLEYVFGCAFELVRVRLFDILYLRVHVSLHVN